MEKKKYPVKLGDIVVGECEAPDENGVSEVTITSPELLELVNKAPSFGMSVRYSAEFADDETFILTDSGTIENITKPVKQSVIILGDDGTLHHGVEEVQPLGEQIFHISRSQILEEQYGPDER